MAKGGKKRQRGGTSSNWTAADHAERGIKSTKLASSQLLSHGTKEQQSDFKHKLHIRRTKKALYELKKQLQKFDCIEYTKKCKQEFENQRKRREEEEEFERTGIKKKKRGRLGPETWKLKGAAR